jgi:Cof subfamily protein (haloacid dehalogenase superfamily)
MLLAQKKTDSAPLRYKMLVLDLDDTLLRDDYTISPRNKALLMKAQELGVKVVLASGRPTPAMLQYAQELALASFDSYLISFNGAVVTAMKPNEVIFERSLTCEEVHSIYDYGVANKVHIITYSDKGVISETESEYIDVELGLTGLPLHKVPSFKTEVQTSAVKCILLEDPAYLKQLEPKLKLARPDLSIARSKPFFLEVMPKGIDKAASIAFLIDRLGIKQSEVIAVGNAGNDLTMVEFAGLGVWVDNVDPDLRHRADAIVASNNDIKLYPHFSEGIIKLLLVSTMVGLRMAIV